MFYRGKCDKTVLLISCSCPQQFCLSAVSYSIKYASFRSSSKQYAQITSPSLILFINRESLQLFSYGFSSRSGLLQVIFRIKYWKVQMISSFFLLINPASINKSRKWENLFCENSFSILLESFLVLDVHIDNRSMKKKRIIGQF